MPRTPYVSHEFSNPENVLHHAIGKLTRSIFENFFSITAQQRTFVNFLVHSSATTASVIKNEWVTARETFFLTECSLYQSSICFVKQEHCNHIIFILIFFVRN
jgi:hypothetical protein